MARYIDADATVERLEEWNTSDDMDKALYNFALNRINEQPTADVIEREKLLKWIEEKKAEASNEQSKRNARSLRKGSKRE